MASALLPATSKPTVSFSVKETSSTIKTTQVRPQPLVLYPKGSDRPYMLLKKLGSGGHSTVWEALTPEGRHVAIKIHRIGLAYLEESVQEGKNLRKLQRAPHVIQWRGDFDLAGVCYKEVDPALCIAHEKGDEQRHAILMDMLPCANAYEKFIKSYASKETSGLSQRQVMSIARQALETLQYLRSKGIVHGDLKPENMVYDELTDQLTIIDFGSLQRRRAIDPSILIQSRYYRAPERLLFEDYNESIDMWSLGVSLFELYIGTVPFLIHGEDDDLQTIIDYWHLIIQNLGEKPSLKFINAAPPFYRRLFKQGESCELAYPPREKSERIMDRYAQVKEYYPDIPIWKAYIYEAAQWKQESRTDAKRLIDLIAPMFRYEGRVTPGRALRHLERFLVAEADSNSNLQQVDL